MLRLLLSLVLAVSIISAHAADDAAMFRGNAAHTGVYTGRAIKVPVLKWKFSTKGKVIASPALAGGTLYIGSTDGNFYALDAANGAQRWKFATHARIVSSAAVANGTVFFSSYDHNF